MIMLLKSIYFGLTKFELVGLNLNLFLRKMQAKNVHLKNIKRNKNSLSFVVNYVNYLEVIKYLKTTNINYKNQQIGGLKNALINTFKRGGVIVACLFWLGFYLWFNTNIKEVVCYGDTAGINTKEIENIIINNNNNNLRVLEREIINSNSDISGCTIEKKGYQYFVKLYKIVKNSPSTQVISKYNCKILNFTLASGKSEVKAGDVVSKDQVICKSTETEMASVKLKAEAWVVGSAFFDEDNRVLARTGQSEVTKCLNIFGVQLGKFKTPNFTMFEYEDTKKLVSNFILPIYVTSRTYYELSPSKESVKFEDMEADLKQIALNNAKALLEDGVLYTESYSIIKEGLKYKIDCYLKFLYEI